MSNKFRHDLIAEGPFSGMYSVHEYDPLNPVAFCVNEDAARLFAAAPDLLEVARSAAAIGFHSLPDGKECKCSRCEMVREARVAIAKATGSAAC